MDPNEILRRLRELRDNIRDGSSDGLPDDMDNLLDGFEALDGWLSAGGFLPGAWERQLQVLVTLPDRQQVGMFISGGDAEVHLRDQPSFAWEPPLPKVDTSKTGTAHVAGTYHVGGW